MVGLHFGRFFHKLIWSPCGEKRGGKPPKQLSSDRLGPATDVMIFEIFSQIFWQKFGAFDSQRRKIFEKNAIFFAENCWKSQKIVIINNIDHGYRLSFGTTWQHWPQNISNGHKIYQMTTYYTKWPQTIPNDHKSVPNDPKIYQIARKIANGT
jgi:hypothetical protein